MTFWKIGKNKIGDNFRTLQEYKRNRGKEKKIGSAWKKSEENWEK